jgi:hypothetical protein
MMDDRFLHALRRAPRPDFSAELRRRLAADEEARQGRSFGRRRALRRGLLSLVPAAAVLALVLFPEVRAGAQAFLELFRVRNFVAVNVDAERLKALGRDGVSPLSLVGEHVDTSPPEPPLGFDDPAQAFLAAGYPANLPASLPDGIHADSAVVIGAREGELRIEARKLNELLSTLGIHDVAIPPALDGSRIGMRTSRAVAVRYDNAKGRPVARLVQAPHPELSLPAGLERAQLAEIALRVAGLEADEARRFAARIDWNSTILVPVPTGQCTFREVEVKGRKALLIESARPRGQEGPGRDDGRVLLWSDDERVYALAGTLADPSMLLMAGSLP